MRFLRRNKPDGRGGSNERPFEKIINGKPQQTIPAVIENQVGDVTLVAAAAGVAVNPGINYYRTQFLHFEEKILLVAQLGKMGGISADGCQS